MDAETERLSPEQQRLLQSYQIFLEQSRYREVTRRVRAARDCLDALGLPTAPLEPHVFAACQQRVSPSQAGYLLAFRRYLVQVGRLAEEKTDGLERRIALLPEPTASLLRRYVRHMKRQNLAPGTVARRVWVLVRWLRRCPPAQQADVGLIDRETVERLIEEVQDQGQVPGTINTQLADVQSFLLFLSREGVVAGSPVLRQRWLREPEALPRAMAPVEVARFLAVLEGAQDRALFLLLLRTGLRGSEAVGLRVQDVDLARQSVVIRHSVAKMAKSRVVYLSADAVYALQSWLGERGTVPTERLFFCWPHLALTRGTINWRYKRYRARAGIAPPYTAHSLRHTFATELLNAGASLVTVQELLGHEHLSTTQVYARLSGAVKQAEYVAAMAKIEGRCAGVSRGPTEEGEHVVAR